jgi:hypothetical protein
VLAATTAHTDAPPHLFRTYSESEDSSLKLVDVARATSASPGLSHAVSLGHPPIEYLDAGSVGYNNPTEIALEESHKIWPERKIDVLLSLGTGSQQIVDVGRGENLTPISQRLVESCEAVHNRLLSSPNPLPYFRFSVDRGLDDIGVRKWSQTGRLTNVTSGYLRAAKICSDLQLCVRAINGGSEPIGTWCLCTRILTYYSWQASEQGR